MEKLEIKYIPIEDKKPLITENLYLHKTEIE